MQKTQNYFVLSFYLIHPIENPKELIKSFKDFFKSHDIQGRIYINEEGINAQMSVFKKDAPLFLEWYFQNKAFRKSDIKTHLYHEHVFPKKTVKYRKQLVALDKHVDYSKRGAYLSPLQWKEMLDKKDDKILILDVRNDYEWDVGHFKGALRPECKTFREFPFFLEKIKKRYPPEEGRPILMSCTGGIRCEFYSCLCKEAGYLEVYQLQGGIIQYGVEVGSEHWLGELFVFDDRLVIPIVAEGQSDPIGKCHHCNAKTSTIYNCANMDCNDLFLSCLDCTKKFLGCCSSSCLQTPRRREIAIEAKPKPYRKLSFNEKLKFNS